jgi:hypothetical protein
MATSTTRRANRDAKAFTLQVIGAAQLRDQIDCCLGS